MTAQKIRENFLSFFEKRGHTVVPSSSLIPDDPSVLLTTAGMQQFKSYFIGRADAQRDFGSLNTVSIQKSFRTSDIDEVGDESHLTFFEMLGNFSFGGYWKKEAIKYAYDFLKELGLAIQYVTVFAGDNKSPRDMESEKIWHELSITDIRAKGREDNFWGPTGTEGPCGPTTEIFIGDVEIWNLVFNEYYCRADGVLGPLQTFGVDTGMGLDRLAVVLQKKKNVFETDLLAPLIAPLPPKLKERTKRIIADHVRASAFLIADGVRPSNKEAGYILRRLMRRIIVYKFLAEESKYNVEIIPILDQTSKHYGLYYKELNKQIISSEFQKEEEKFRTTLRRGMRELDTVKILDAQNAFRLYESFGLPYEIIKEVGGARAKNLTREAFDGEFKKHQERSRAGLEAKFGGHGLLLDTGELKARDENEVKIVTRLHTATHLMQAALRAILGVSVHQAGSDINAARARFDFTFERRLTDGEIHLVEDWVNDKIKRDLRVVCKEMPFEEARNGGALYFAKEKYPDTVKVYSVVDERKNETYSRELCGGPHVQRTADLGHFRIAKQESVSAGVRRIRAILE